MKDSVTIFQSAPGEWVKLKTYTTVNPFNKH